METDVTVNDAAAPAKCELLARLRNNHIIPDFDFATRTDAEVRANIDAAIEAARCGPAPVGAETDDDDELVEAARVPAAPRRQRKKSLTTLLRQARNAGADRVEYSGAVIHLTGNGAAPVEADVNEWEGEPA